MRTRMSPKPLAATLLAAAFLAGSAAAVEAAADDATRGWVLRVGPTWIDSDRGEGVVIGYDGSAVSGREARDVGLGVAGEYRFSPRLGLEVGVLATSNGVGVQAVDGVIVRSGTSDTGSLTLGPDVHLTPGRAADLYLGPFLAYTARTDVGYSRDEFAGVRIRGSFGWGAVVGLDVPIGQRGWRVCASVRYIETNLEGTNGAGDRFDLDFGPTAVGVGFGYRFRPPRAPAAASAAR